MEDNKYIVERLSPDNLHHLVELYWTVHKKRISVKWIEGKYNTKYLGVENIGYLAFTKHNKAAAFYGVIPSLIQLDQQILMAAQSADTMTHPNHRMHGLFIQLAQMTYELARVNNIKFIFGFPNQNSLRGFNKLKWKISQEKMQFFSLKASAFPYAKLIFKSKWLSEIYVSIVQRALSNKSVQENIFSANTVNEVHHNNQFVNYKRYNPTFITNIGDVSLWIKIDGLLRVGFVKIPKNFDAFSFKNKIKKTAVLLGCSEVLFITHKNSKLYHALNTIIQPADSLPIGFYNLGHEQFEFDKIGFEYCDIDTF